MGKTYNTISTFVSGAILTASQMNGIGTNVNNYRVPPACSVYRSSNETSYSAGANITWTTADYDTESPSDPMWASGANADKVYIRTAGLYLINFRVLLGATATVTGGQIEIGVSGTLRSIDITPAYSSTAVYGMSTYFHSCAVGDYVTADVVPSGGSAYYINGGATNNNNQSRLTVAWVGQVS